MSLPNRTAERRGRLSVTNVTGLLLSCFVENSLNVDVFFFALLQKDLFEGMWSLAEGFFKQNYFHACHTRFAVVFPLPSCCVSSLGTLSRDDDDGSENVGKEMNLRSFKLITSIWTRSICQMQATFPGIEFLMILFRFKKRKENSWSYVHVLYKMAN